MHSRRLTVELMEGRMMLSATGAETPQPVLDLTQFSFWPSRFSLAAAYETIEAAPTDGGFANTLADISSVVEQWHVNIGAPTAAGTSIRDSFTNLAGYGVTRSDFHLSTNLLLDSNALDVAVITPWADNEPPVINMQPVVVGPSRAKPGISEGGAIPIHAIFADFHKDSHLASGVKVVSSPATETSVVSLATTRRLSTPDVGIAGEWARATIFEIAGGEPASNESQSPTGNDQTLQHSKPLSSVETPQPNAKLARQHDAVPPTQGSPAAEPGQPQAAPVNGEAAAVMTQLLNSELLAGTSGALGVGQFPVIALATENPDINAFAAAAVFDQLGDGNAAVIESSFEGKSLLRSIGTSPLLMVLALERIAALNSRRATRESRIAAGKIPPRLPR